MTQARVFAVLLAVATVVVAAAILAAAEYHDDAREHSQLFVIAGLTARIGFFIVLGLAIGLAVLWLGRHSGKAGNSDVAADDD